MFHIYRPLEFLFYFYLRGDGVFISIGERDYAFFNYYSVSLQIYLPSEPAKSTIFSKLSQDFPSLLRDLILI